MDYVSTSRRLDLSLKRPLASLPPFTPRLASEHSSTARLLERPPPPGPSPSPSPPSAPPWVSGGLAAEPTLQPERGLYIATGAAGMVPGCYQSTCAIAEPWRCNTATASPHASAASSSASPADTRPVNLPRISTWVLHQRPDQCWGALAGLL